MKIKDQRKSETKGTLAHGAVDCTSSALMAYSIEQREGIPSIIFEFLTSWVQ
jgi:hypothetical protein